MKWSDPELVAVGEDYMREFMFAIAYEEAWESVGGFGNFVVECAARHGCVARVIDLSL